MSLEIAIQKNTEAIHVLVELLKSGAVPAPIVGAAKDAIVKTAKVADAPKPEVVNQASPAEAEPTKLTYDDIRKPFLDLVNKKGREVAQQLLNDLGIPTGSKLSAIAEADYGKALAAIQKASA